MSAPTMPPGHEQWLAKRAAREALRAELAECRRAGKAIRHRDRLRRIEAAERAREAP